MPTELVLSIHNLAVPGNVIVSYRFLREAIGQMYTLYKLKYYTLYHLGLMPARTFRWRFPQDVL